MKSKLLLFFSILFVTSLLLMWLLPSLFHKLTFKPDRYPFVYYSTVLDELAIIDYQDKAYPMTSISGVKYSAEEMDSLLPTLNYRQLMNDGRLPDSIKGQAISPRLLRTKSFSFRFNPAETDSPDCGLHILFESMPKRGGLTLPDDVFRLNHKMEFIKAVSNSVDAVKSNIFQEELIKQGYSFPAKWIAGNPNPRKAYDEGYFSLDNDGQLFHIKMVNGRPYIRNTGIGQGVDIAFFSMLEVADKRFYGFLFSKKGGVFIILNEAGNYQIMKLDIPQVDIKKDQVLIMGNPFDWTVSVINDDGKFCYALDNGTLKQIDKYSIMRVPGKWETCVKWLFPVYLTFDNKYSGFLAPHFYFTGFYALILNVGLAVCYCFVCREIRIVKFLKMFYVLFTGIAGFFALLILPKTKKL